MRKISIVFSLLCVLVLSASAQKTKLTMEEAIIGRWTKLSPQNLSGLQWRGDMNAFTYVKDNALFQQEAKTGKETQILNLEKLNEAVKASGMDELKRFPRIGWLSSDEFSFYGAKGFCFFDMKEMKISKSYTDEAGAGNQELAPNNEIMAYTIENNLYVSSVAGEKYTITSESNKGIVYGQSVHRNEFGINGGIFWSPKSNYLAFYRMDESMVSDYPLVNIDERVAKLENIKYPMAGMKSHEVTLGVYDFKTKKTIYLKTGEPKEQYLTNIAWSPDEKTIYIAVINREQNHMKFNAYDAQTGDFKKTLFEEKHDKYVEPQHAMIFLKKKANLFIWQSQRDGYNHAYLYNTDGKLLKQITKGDWIITEILGFDKSEKYMYYVSTEETPLDRHAYKISLSSGKKYRLDKAEGYHSYQMNANATYLLDRYSSLNVPNKIDLISSKGKFVRNLLTSTDPMKDKALGEIELGVLKAKDGKTDLHYRLIKPVDFDPNKKYPVIVYVYGGPHAQLVTNRWLGQSRLWQHYMAGKGYIAFTLDNRGSAGRGLEFENAIHRNLGVKEISDQMTGVEFLQGLNYVDVDRIGVHGWSYGGFMTTSLMLKQPETFKVGVAGGPVIDWKYYEIMYGERYMDTPQENPEGYKNANLKNYVKNLEGRLMIIHGAIDPTVVWQHSLSFVRECVKNGILIDYFPYPRHEHNVRGYDRIHLMNKVSQYFEDFL